MNYRKKLIFVFCLNLFAGLLFSQDSKVLLDKIKEKYSSIIDYQADINIRINVDFISIPEKKARIYYKKPNLFKYEADDFIMLPKKGLNFSINEILSINYSYLNAGVQNINNIKTEIIKIIPLESDYEIILATLWIDKSNTRVIRAEVNTKKNGTFIIDLAYFKPDDILPATLKITFDVTYIDIPFGFLLETGGEVFNKKNDISKSEGTVIINYSNYIINSGLNDSFFKEQKKKKNAKIK
jgi:hypothetical protein